MLSDHRQKMMLYWLGALVPAALFCFIQDGSLIYVPMSFLTMIVHELGHAFFAFLSLIPAVSFFFATFALSTSPSWQMAIVVVPLEVAASYYLWKGGKRQAAIIPAVIATLQLAFLFLAANPGWFSVYGGLAGEMCLPLVFSVFMAEFNRLRGSRGWAVYMVCSTVFWHSLMLWILAMFAIRPIPYPRDGEGGIALFQDPFSLLDGRPVGDIDVLIRTYGFTEEGLKLLYLYTGLVALAAYLYLWHPQLAGAIRHLKGRC